MALNEKDIEVIDKSLRGILTKEESIYLAKRKDDPLFEKELLLKSDMFAVYQSLEMEEGKRKLQVLEGYMKSNKNGTKKNSTYRGLIILMFIILAAILSYFIIFQKDNSSVLYASYYNPYPNVVSPIDRNSTEERDAYQLYEAGEYSGAIVMFENALPDENQQFFYALSLIGDGQIEDARRAMTEISNSTSRYRSPAEWYLAMCHLRLKDKASCINVLEEIEKNNNHPYRNQAKELREQL